ncbi:MAG: TetR/AcrR family transcriptional regulator C-terminal domain-containing protein [Micropruina sp.]|uniref:TetR/AcrR family transcriptional regulator C-terminal domain-containing protein n=1 Tax=Micropruina sp. TaxID=2737536 RepID=UPI0039E4AEE9
METQPNRPAPRRQARGQAVRREILRVAARLGVAAGEVSVAKIAEAAGVYPNQVTYYFGSKDALIVESAFLAVLADARRLERLGNAATTPEAFRANLARAGLAMPSTPQLVQALVLAGRKPELQALVGTGMTLIFRQSERYLERVLRRRGWVLGEAVATEVRRFWAVVLGSGLITNAGFSGTPGDIDLPGILSARSPGVQEAARPATGRLG